MPSPSITYDSATVAATITTWGQVHALDVEATLLIHFEQKFPVRSVLVLAASAETDVLMLKLRSDQWKEDKELGLTASGSLIW